MRVEDREIVLEPRRSSIRTARHWVVGHADEAAATASARSVIELLTSELVANALVHGPDQPVRIRAGVADGEFRVAVSDAGDELPVTRSTGPEVPGGHGMRLVARLAERWGVEPHPVGGKTLWFTVRLDRVP